MKKAEDNLLWDSFISGNDDAYEYIYQQNIQKLFLYGMTFTSDEELVRDCIQDVFIKLYKNRKHLGTTNNIRLYLLSALKNTLFNAFRKQSIYKEFLKRMENEKTTGQDTIIEQMIYKEEETDLKKQVDAFWSLLTGRQKEVVYYKFIEGLDLSEISNRLGIDYHSTANVIQRAFKKIRNFYLKK